MLREFPPFSLFKSYLLTMIRSPIIGTIVGALPGAGATIAAFLSYGEAARTAKREPEKFGKGAVEGLMAAECANNASTGGSMTILLSLGIPGSNTTAMMIAAFMIHGMQPGPLLLSTRPDIVYGIFVSMLLTNLLLLGLTILAIRMFLELNRMPYSIFSAAIMILCVIGAYGLTNNMDDVYLMFGIFADRLCHAQVRDPGGPVHPGAGAGGHGGAVPATGAADFRRQSSGSGRQPHQHRPARRGAAFHRLSLV